MNKKKAEKKEQKPKLIKGVLLKGNELVRICNPDKKHYNYEWHDGENIDILPFISEGSCSEGGLYFTTLEHLLYFNSFSNYLGDHWFVTITVDANEDVWQEPNGKWKAHRVMVTSMTLIKDMPEEVLYRMASLYLQHYRRVNFEPFNLDKREDLWNKVISIDSYFFQFVRDQTNKICRTAVSTKRILINWIRNPISAVAIAGEFNVIADITKWSCELVDAFLVSGQYTFRFKYYGGNGLWYICNPGDLNYIDRDNYYDLRLVVIKSESNIQSSVQHLTRELVDHIYDKVYKNNDRLMTEEK